jgi:hypothetical protein
MRNVKAQSAMEYLMTYGWAFLIIAVVLGALFQLGAFSGSSLIGSSCVASAGLKCSEMTLTHANGWLALKIGQIGPGTGGPWGNAIIMFAQQGSAMSGNGPVVAAPPPNYPGNLVTSIVSANAVNVIGPLANGGYIGVTFNAFQGPVATGTPLAGSLWACYTPTVGAGITYNGLGAGQPGTCYTYGPTGGTIYYIQLATLNTKAV